MSDYGLDPLILAVGPELVRMRETTCERLEKKRVANGWKPGQIYQTLQDEGEYSLSDYYYEWWLEGVESDTEEWS